MNKVFVTPEVPGDPTEEDFVVADEFVAPLTPAVYTGRREDSPATP